MLLPDAFVLCLRFCVDWPAASHHVRGAHYCVPALRHGLFDLRLRPVRAEPYGHHDERGDAQASAPYPSVLWRCGPPSLCRFYGRCDYDPSSCSASSHGKIDRIIVTTSRAFSTNNTFCAVIEASAGVGSHPAPPRLVLDGSNGSQ